MKKLWKVATLASVVLFSTGCATIVSESSYPVNIKSTPSGASFVIKNRAGEEVKKGVTPDLVTLKAGAGYFKGEKYQITFTLPKKGNQAGVEKTVELDTSLDGWYLGGNLVLMNPLMILVKIIKLRWIHILSYDQMVSRKINNQTTRCANSIFYTTLFTNSAPNYT